MISRKEGFKNLFTDHFLNKIYTLIQNQDLHIDQVGGDTFSQILKQRIWQFVHLG